MRISSPPVVSPCFYGIDLADEDELAAAHRSVEEMREHVGATSLHYLSVEGMQAATELPEDAVCRACFTREYPTRVPRAEREAPLRAAWPAPVGCWSSAGPAAGDSSLAGDGPLGRQNAWVRRRRARRPGRRREGTRPGGCDYSIGALRTSGSAVR